jgi:hypothetical protein
MIVVCRDASRDIITPANIVGADGRWTPRVKSRLLQALHLGVITMTEAQRRFLVSQEELLEWERSFRDEGEKGLRLLKNTSRVVT